MDAVMDSLRSLPQSEDRDVLLNNLGYATSVSYTHLATGFQRCKGVFLTPHPVDFIEILRADGSIRFQSDVSIRLHEIKDIVVVTLDRRCV